MNDTPEQDQELIQAALQGEEEVRRLMARRWYYAQREEDNGGFKTVRDDLLEFIGEGIPMEDVPEGQTDLVLGMMKEGELSAYWHKGEQREYITRTRLRRRINKAGEWVGYVTGTDRTMLPKGMWKYS